MRAACYKSRMVSRSVKASRRGAPADPGAASPLAYQAVVFPSGEIPAIHETVGRRRLRTIDPRSREGRDLLASGRVRFWREAGRPAEPLPVEALFRTLVEEARAEHSRHAADPTWDRSCRARLDALESWAAIYAGRTSRDH